MIAAAAALLVLQSTAVAPRDFGLDAWQDCIGEQRDALRDADEPVEAIATAVIALCRDREVATQAEIYRAMDFIDSPRERQLAAERETQETRRIFRDALIAHLVRYRMRR